MNSNLKIRDYSMFVGKKQDVDYYEWCVFIDADRETLNRIVAVEYTLHPTFPNPIRLVKDSSSRFALFSSGWGGFEIGVNVEWRDGTHQRFPYDLALAADNWPLGPPEPTRFDNAEVEAIYRALFHERFRWRKAETVARITRIPETRVSEILDQLSKQDLVRKAAFLSFERKELWGPTATVGISPRL
jgi:transcription initiation factor IIF auxiliary subunit